MLCNTYGVESFVFAISVPIHICAVEVLVLTVLSDVALHGS